MEASYPGNNWSGESFEWILHNRITQVICNDWDIRVTRRMIHHCFAICSRKPRKSSQFIVIVNFLMIFYVGVSKHQDCVLLVYCVISLNIIFGRISRRYVLHLYSLCAAETARKIPPLTSLGYNSKSNTNGPPTSHLCDRWESGDHSSKFTASYICILKLNSSSQFFRSKWLVDFPVL